MRDVDTRDGKKEGLTSVHTHLLKFFCSRLLKIAQALQSKDTASSKVGSRIPTLEANALPFLRIHLLIACLFTEYLHIKLLQCLFVLRIALIVGLNHVLPEFEIVPGLYS